MNDSLHRTGRSVLTSLLIIALVVLNFAARAHNPTACKGAYEVWLMDQSDTREDGGGTLYIYQGEDLEGEKAGEAAPEAIDLGGAAREFCLAQTGSAPRRPHMAFFNDEHTHAILAFVATGHVLFLDAEERTPVVVVDVGAQAHAAVPSPDGTFV